jgi:hypothetical protein
MMRPVFIGFPELKPKELTESMLRECIRQAEQYLKTKNLNHQLSLSFQLFIRACNLALEAMPRPQPSDLPAQPPENTSSPQSKNAGCLNPCYISMIQPCIASNGNFLLCSSGVDRPLGNINRDNIVSMWQNKDNLALRIAATQMHRTNKPVFSACTACGNVLYHSTVFHRIYSRIPFLPGRLAARLKH